MLKGVYYLPDSTYLLHFPWCLLSFSLFSQGWIRTCLRLHNRIPPPRLPSIPQEACAPGLISRSAMTRLLRQPFPARPSRALSCPSKRFVPSHIRWPSTETRSPTYPTPTREPSASSEKLTGNTWLRTDSQTLPELRQDLSHRQKLPARKWWPNRAPCEHNRIFFCRGHWITGKAAPVC